MRTVKTLFLVCFFSFISLAATPADTTKLNQIILVALQPSPLENNLHRLTDEIGGRVPGTVAMQHAVSWGRQAFTAAGADSVHTEGFTIPVSWSEGDTEMTATTAYQVSATGVGGGTVLSPFRVRAVSMAWAPALAPVKHVPMVDVGEMAAKPSSRKPEIFPARSFWCTPSFLRHGTIFLPNIRSLVPSSISR